MTTPSLTFGSRVSPNGSNPSWGTQMSDSRQTVIDGAWDERDAIGPATRGEVRQAVDSAIAALASGEVRIAEPSGDGWTVHQWLKKAVLLSFRLNPMEAIAGGPGGAPLGGKKNTHHHVRVVA